MPRRALLALLAAIVLIAPGVRAQNFGLSVYGAFDRVQMDREDYVAAFFDSYNAYYTARLRSPMEPVAMTRQRPVAGVSFDMGVGAMQTHIFVETAFDAPQTRTADLGSGLKNHLSVDVNDLAFGTDLVFAIGPVSLGGTFAGIVRRSTITFESEYADGRRSRGSEYVIHGRYTADNAFLEVGPTLGLSMGRLRVPVRLLFPVELGSDRTPLYDDDTYELNDYFPSDWDRYIRDTSGTDETNAIANRDFVGPRLQVGLAFRLL